MGGTCRCYSLGQLLQETNDVGRRIRYDYDALGRKVRTTTPLHVTRSTTYSGQTTTHQESWAGLAGMASAVLNTTVVTFDPTTGERTTTDPLGNVVTEKLGADGQVLSLTDARGRTTTFFYDRFNRLIRTELPLGLATEATYDLRGNAETQTNELGQVTQTQYDSLRQVRFVTAPSGTITERTYDVSGNVRTEETSYTSSGPGDRPDLNRLTTWTYTPRNQVETQTVDPAGLNLTTTTTYDAVGNAKTVTDPYGNTTTFEYDSLNRRTKVIDPLGHATTTQYPNFGMEQVVTDHLNNVTTTSLDNDGNVIEVEDAEGGLTIYTRDGWGNLLEIEDPVGNTTKFTYDALHRVKSVENEHGDARRFYYDPNGNTELQVDRNGRVTWFEYDDLNRRIHERWMGTPVIPENGPTAAFDPAAAERTLSFTYDALGRITSAADPSASYTYDSYDVTGGLKDSTATLNGLATTVRQTATFNAVGQRLSLNLLLNGTADVLNSYAYDAAGRTTTVTQQDGGGGSIQWKQLGFEYDLENSDPDISHQTRITRLITDATNVVAVTTADYDKASRLTSLQHAAGSTSRAGYDYTYDAINRITQIDSMADGLATFTYDRIDQLATADFATQSNEAYTYDENGNRTGGGYSTGTNNRLLSDGTYNYEYDAEGNRTQRVSIALDMGGQPEETVDYNWDYHNRLTHLTFTDGSGTLTKQVWYEYDVFDRRISKTIDSTGDGTSNHVEHFVYEDSPTSDLDGIAVIFTDEDGAAGPEPSAVSNRLFHGPDVDQVFADENALGEVLWNLTDHQGTVRDIVEYDDSTSTTEVVRHIKYGAFGNIDSVEDASGSAIPNGESEIRFGYTGREWDEDAGLYYYRARWYDAVPGRFISEDPLGFEAGDTNLNRYVGNNAWNLRDASGRDPREHMGPAELFWHNMSERNAFQTNPERAELLMQMLAETTPASGISPEEYLGTPVYTAVRWILGVSRHKDFGEYKAKLIDTRVRERFYEVVLPLEHSASRFRKQATQQDGETRLYREDFIYLANAAREISVNPRELDSRADYFDLSSAPLTAAYARLATTPRNGATPTQSPRRSTHTHSSMRFRIDARIRNIAEGYGSAAESAIVKQRIGPRATNSAHPAQRQATPQTYRPTQIHTISPAHQASRITPKTRFGDGSRKVVKTVAKGTVDLEKDLSEINSGNAQTLSNGDIIVSTGRIFRRHTDKPGVFPLSGSPGTVDLTQAEFQVFKKMVKDGGLRNDARRALDGMRRSGNAGISDVSEQKLNELFRSRN